MVANAAITIYLAEVFGAVFVIMIIGSLVGQFGRGHRFVSDWRAGKNGHQ